MYYIKCHLCGANLDPGEQCGCKILAKEKQPPTDNGKVVSQMRYSVTKVQKPLFNYNTDVF